MMVTKSEQLKGMTPDLVADVVLYETDAGGRSGPALAGYGCPCMVSKTEPLRGYDAKLLLGDVPLYPGQLRRLGLVFLSPDAMGVMRDAHKFYLWEGRFIGEAVVVED